MKNVKIYETCNKYFFSQCLHFSSILLTKNVKTFFFFFFFNFFSFSVATKNAKIPLQAREVSK